MNWCTDLKKIIKGKVKSKELLSKHTTFRIGGPADIWIEPCDLDELAKIVKFAKRNELKIFIIGNGSNLLVKDKGYRGIVVKLNSPFFKNIEFNDNKVTVGSGLNLNQLINFTKNKNLSGCEFFVGIPATVGGALVTNAGVSWTPSFKNKRINITDLIEQVNVLNSNGKIKTLKKQDLKFDYRYSNLDKYIIISASFKLRPKKKSEIDKVIRKISEYRKMTQGIREASAGCIFKNPTYSGKNICAANRLSAAKLIDLCGLKGKIIGDAAVSKEHANYIINRKRAKAADVLGLIKIIQNRVKDKFDIYLEPEIKMIGEN